MHDYSVRDSHAATWIWHAVCWGIIIPSGWRQTRDATLYRHLWRSVLTFDGAAQFRQRMGDAGFAAVHSETMPGWETNIVAHLPRDARDDRSASPDVPGSAGPAQRHSAVVAAASGCCRRRDRGPGRRDGLAERGISVDVVEREDYLGGRVGAWTEQYDRVEVAMNRGFHAFFRQYSTCGPCCAASTPRCPC